jgi:hypothetical protein
MQMAGRPSLPSSDPSTRNQHTPIPLWAHLEEQLVEQPRNRTALNGRDEKSGLRRDAAGSQVIDVPEAQEIKETGNEEGQLRTGTADDKVSRANLFA